MATKRIDKEELEKTPGEKARLEAEQKAAMLQDEFIEDAVQEIVESIDLGNLQDILNDGVLGNEPRFRERLLASVKAGLRQRLASLSKEAEAQPGGTVVPRYGARRSVFSAGAGVGASGAAAIPPPGGSGGTPSPGSGDGSGSSDPLDRRRGVPVVQLGRTTDPSTPDEVLWDVIKDRARAISFNNYAAFIDQILCGAPSDSDPKTWGDDIQEYRLKLSSLSGIRGRDAYQLLRWATEAFLMQESGLLSDVLLDQISNKNVPNGDLTAELKLYRSQYLKDLGNELPAILPYYELIREKLEGIEVKKFGQLILGRGCYGIIPSRIASPPLLELIWTYWHEEAGVIQSLKAISLRFQNKNSPALKNPLERFAIDPLRPLNNLLWGFIEGESDRLSLPRRAYEYEHEYGLSIVGKAVPKLRPVDRRTKFLEAFHTLLHLCSEFYKEDRDATIYTDGFPLLTALKEVHLLLAQGAHNQYGDLVWESRAEILIQQWLLARPEMREFLGSRVMVPYEEPWMGRLETMRHLQDWGDSPVALYRDLAVFGEQLLLSVRFGSWTEVKDPNAAANWARAWQTEAQTYIHAYRSLTGVDLSTDSPTPLEINATPPAHLLAARGRHR